MDHSQIADHITAWLRNYCDKAGLSGFIVGISGGIDSALTSTLCARTGKKTILLNMPIRQTTAEFERAVNHIKVLNIKYDLVFVLVV
ncbi:MAG: NAD(+) synthase, partial [Flavobacteriales bacterium]